MKTLYFILRYALLGTVYQLSNECIQRTVLFCKTLLTFATVHFCTNLAYIARWREIGRAGSSQGEVHQQYQFSPLFKVKVYHNNKVTVSNIIFSPLCINNSKYKAYSALLSLSSRQGIRHITNSFLLCTRNSPINYNIFNIIHY